jgi:hypothetical protein
MVDVETSRPPSESHEKPPHLVTRARSLHSRARERHVAEIHIAVVDL